MMAAPDHMPPDMPASLLAATARARSDYPALRGTVEADVVVIGGGYTGLSAALHPGEAGRSVVLLEAELPWWGASGRNDGQLNPGLKDAPVQIEARFGPEMGARIVAMTGGCANLVFDLHARHGIACNAVRPGWLRAATTPRAMAALAEVAWPWRARGADVDLLDMSSFGKIRVEGRDACAFLARVCAYRVDVDAGQIVYTQMLTPRGGIESDLTVTRLSETAFLLVVPGATLQRDLSWLRRHLGDAFVVITDVTAAEALLPLMRPKARDVLAACSPDDLSNAAFPFGAAREIEIGMGIARTHRVSYVGALVWELCVSTDRAAHAFEAVIEVGAEHSLQLCGLHAMHSCRLEKAYRHFGHDITDADHVLEAGIGSVVKPDKGDFIGRDAVLAKRDAGLDRRLMQFRLQDPDAFPCHNEPLLRDGQNVSYLTSDSYGHAMGSAVGLGYVPCAQPGETTAEMPPSSYAIEIAGRLVPAEASLKPLYDPTSARVRA
ncbi:MAG: GcvT family protein [Rhodobacteraceae bacterium]|nr:GcvT family protein [Paracoccaceae bacterium]